MMRRIAAKVDANQAEIVKALRKAGAKVQPIHTVGKGCPDIIVAHNGRWYAAEIKDGNKPPSARELTDDEKKWHEEFSQAAPVHIWKSIEDALTTIGAASSN